MFLGDFNEISLYLTSLFREDAKDVGESAKEGLRQLSEQVKEAEALRTCKVCWAKFSRSQNNKKGKCGHSGTWHSAYSDCSIVKCGFGLKTNIGKQHWSCCYATIQDSPCPHSSYHVELVQNNTKA